jgi:hypothetical protein
MIDWLLGNVQVSLQLIESVLCWITFLKGFLIMMGVAYKSWFSQAFS